MLHPTIEIDGETIQRDGYLLHPRAKELLETR
jgi:hypothetical protein